MARTDAAQTFTGTQTITTIGGLTTVTGTGALSITGGAGNATITGGTGASRTITLNATTSGSAVSQVLVGTEGAVDFGATTGNPIFNFWGNGTNNTMWFQHNSGLTLLYGNPLRFAAAGTSTATLSHNASGVLQVGTGTTGNALGALLLAIITIGASGTALANVRILTSSAMVGGTVTVTDTAAISTTKYFPIVKIIGTVTVPSTCYASTINVGASVVLTAGVPTDTSTWYVLAIN